MTDDGGPLFPNPREGEEGVTLRDFFAAHAMTGLLLVLLDDPLPDDVDAPSHVAAKAFALADAMLEARKA